MTLRILETTLAACLITGIVAVLGPRERHEQAADEAWRDLAATAAAALQPAVVDADRLASERAFLERLVDEGFGPTRAIGWVRAAGGAPELCVDTASGAVPPHATRAVAELLGDGALRESGVDDDHAIHVPIRAPDGTVMGALSLWRSPVAGPGVLGDLATMLATAALCGLWLAYAIGRPLRRIEHATRGAVPPAGLTELARRIENQLAPGRIEARVERIAQMRTKALEDRLRHQEDLLSNTAHELRTPLTAVMASVGMLKDGLLDDEKEFRTAIEHADAACQHQLFLINDLVDSAAADAGRLRLEMQPCQLDALADAIEELMAPLASLRGIELLVDRTAAAQSVLADHNRILQIVFNLLGNAIKYSPDGSQVELRTAANEDSIRFEIHDRGIGVPLAQQEGLFQRFSRVHAPSSSSAAGTGLGLHLCKVLVEMMGGEIGFRQREDGTGSVFWFELRRAEPALTSSAT